MKSDEVPEIFADIPVPEYVPTPPLGGAPVSERKIALVSTAGLMHRGETPFSIESRDYRVIDSEDDRDLVMSHVSVNFDRTGFVRDYNVVFPIDRLREKALSGQIGELSRYHYSFMGAVSPADLQPAAESLSGLLRAEKVDGLLLVPI
jgi:D-proline reductase (dithiol) PrdB